MNQKLKKLSIFLIMLLVVNSISFSTINISKSLAAPLGNVEANGNLSVDVTDGNINVKRYNGSIWERQFFDPSSAFIHFDESKYSIGDYYSGNDFEATLISEIPNNNSVTTVWEAGALQITQIVTLPTEDSQFINLEWSIKNTGSTDVSNISFIRGLDTYLSGGDNGAGFWNAATNTVGVYKTIDSEQQRMSFQGVTLPTSYHSARYSSVDSDVINGGGLINDIDPNEETDNGYALEWAKTKLIAGETWNIKAIESFVLSKVIGSGSSVTSNGEAITLPFTLENVSTSEQIVNYSVSTPNDWTASLPRVSDTITTSGTATLDIQVTPPNNVASGTYNIVLTVTTADNKNITIIGNVVVSTSNPSTTSDTATITTSPDAVAISMTSGSETGVAEGIAIESTSPISGAKVYIGEGFDSENDQLIYTQLEGSNIEGSYDSETGVLTLSGEATAADYETALAAIRFTTTGVGTRSIYFSIAGNKLYNPLNGHYYEVINNGSSISWKEAKKAAEQLTLNGFKGYLATITSEEENQFLFEKIVADAWIGATDDYEEINISLNNEMYANQGASEGKWYWVTGPEKGTQFSEGNSVTSYDSVTFEQIKTPATVVDNEFNNWAYGEPNNYPPAEHYAYMYSTQSPGEWNDYPNSLNVTSYLVEYGDDAIEGLSTFKTVTIHAESFVATLNSLEVDGALVNGFNPEVETYNVTLPAGTTVIPTVTATATDTENTTVSIQPASSLPGSTTITVTAEDGTVKTYTINFTVAQNTGGGGGGGSTTPTNNTNVNVIVNGKTESIGQATTTTVGNQTQLTLTVDQAKLQEKLDKEGNNATVIIPVTSTNADVIVGQLNGQMVKNMEDKQATVVVQTPTASYTLPASQINIEAIAAQIGQNVDLKDIQIQITIAKPTEAAAKVVENAAQQGNFSIVVPAVEFTVTYTNGNQSGEVTRFNAYVERTIAIPDGVDPNKITTGIVVKPDGTTYHVPTKVEKIDGKYYAVINSLTNSTYSVVWHPIEFVDVANHWAKDAVNNLGSRMIISGVDAETFAPNRAITRAEFAAIMVRGLGLQPGVGTNGYKDVANNAWYADFVSTANEYNLIAGYEDGTFRPNEQITREQAMAIIARAMTIAELTNELTDAQVASTLATFKDANDIAGYAKEAVAASVQAQIVTGRDGQVIAPKAHITRAEVAQLVETLLQKADLINE